MLVLHRNKGQRIICGSGPRRIVITLVETHNGWSSIGIEAPRDIRVLREELTTIPDNVEVEQSDS